MVDPAGAQQEHGFTLAVEQHGDLPIVSAAGDVDLYSAPELRTHLADLADEGATRVVLDLSRATFLDSMALGVLLGAKKRLAAGGGELELVAPSPEIRRILEITLLNRIFTLHESLDEATRGGAQPSSAASSEG